MQVLDPAMMSYVEQSIVPSLLIDSDRESNKSDDCDISKQQSMFIWNQKYEVSQSEDFTSLA